MFSTLMQMANDIQHQRILRMPKQQDTQRPPQGRARLPRLRISSIINKLEANAGS
jgi:hypothetical protein